MKKAGSQGANKGSQGADKGSRLCAPVDSGAKSGSYAGNKLGSCGEAKQGSNQGKVCGTPGDKKTSATGNRY
ncbi:hypothetical protein SLEP1_g52171 [Rubroshorea leprosula]|uniref:Uncharacterized protein n=1 Tax=Rubroshorea leprosula TaxID=152421 RepID=A0AAV5M6C0_9ROSI|nr:hypothetical protein SLEP1_g52171 [Rubroshorea leprosula]